MPSLPIAKCQVCQLLIAKFAKFAQVCLSLPIANCQVCQVCPSLPKFAKVQKNVLWWWRQRIWITKSASAGEACWRLTIAPISIAMTIAPIAPIAATIAITIGTIAIKAQYCKLQISSCNYEKSWNVTDYCLHWMIISVGSVVCDWGH